MLAQDTLETTLIVDPDREYEALLARYSRLISRAVRRACGTRYASLAPDIEQEVCLALWKRVQRGKKIEHPVSYLYKAAMTTAAAVLRRQRKGDVELEPEREESPAESEAQYGLLPAERERLLDQVLGQLPADQSLALRAYLCGFNHGEVAVLYGWSESVARHRIYRGIGSLRKSYGDARPSPKQARPATGGEGPRRGEAHGMARAAESGSVHRRVGAWRFVERGRLAG